MYVYTAQGRIEMFYDAAPNLGVVGAAAAKTTQEAPAPKTTQEAAPVPKKKGTPCVYVINAKEAPSKCGKCCQDENKYWDKTYRNENNNTYCGCEPITTSVINDNQFVFENRYLESMKTTITYNEKLVTQEACTKKCMNDPLCSYSMFTPQKQCYNSTANYRAGSKVKSPGTVIETKNVPSAVESVYGGNYKMPVDSVGAKTLYSGKLSYPNCAQLCINTPGCTFAVGDHSMACTLSSLDLQKASLVNDMNSATFVPQ